MVPFRQDGAGRGLAQVTAGLPGGMIAVRAADVACPGGAAGAGALVVSAVPVASGEVLVFTLPGDGRADGDRPGRGGAGARLAARSCAAG
jgi:hypothetical protein